MAIQNPESVFRVPARLCKSPTDLSLPYPHGGTALGMIAQISFKPNALYTDITAEEFGGVLVDRIYCGEEPVLSCTLRGWDSDALKAILPNTTFSVRGDGRISKDVRVRFEPQVVGLKYPGYLMSGVSFKLLVSPIAADFHPGVLFYNVAPAFDADTEILFKDGSEFVLRVDFACLPDTTGRCYNLGKLIDIPL
jgi:hypothetical protein